MVFWTDSDSHDLLRNGKNVVEGMQIIEAGFAQVLEISDDIRGSGVKLLGDAWLLWKKGNPSPFNNYLTAEIVHQLQCFYIDNN